MELVHPIFNFHFFFTSFSLFTNDKKGLTKVIAALTCQFLYSLFAQLIVAIITYIGMFWNKF
jgi:hypothetical protein